MTPATALAPAGLVPARREPDPTAPKYVRKVKGFEFQARLWVGAGNGGTVNLGLYPSEEAAARAVRATLRRLAGPLTPVSVWRTARVTGLAPARLLPQHVRRTGVRRSAVGSFPTPEAAHDAAVAALGRPAGRPD
jgi:hypothetical protein